MAHPAGRTRLAGGVGEGLGGVVSEGEALFKQCPNCQNWIPAEVRICAICRHELIPLPFAKKKKLVIPKKAGWMVLGFLLLCRLLSGAGDFFAEDGGENGQAVSTFTPTARPVPTPRATSTPVVSAEVRAYAEEVLPQVQGLSDAMSTLGELFQTPRFGEESWGIGVMASLAMIQVMHEQLVAVRAPPEMAEVHSALTAGSGQCNEATHLITQGFDTGDSTLFDQASTLILQCQAGLTLALQRATDYAEGRKTGATPQSAITFNDANLRDGPGTEFVVVGSISAGQVVDLAGRNETGDWFRLVDGSWIAAFLVDGAPAGLPVVGQ